MDVKEKLEAIWPKVIGAVITKRNDRVNLAPINYQATSTIYETPLSVCIGLGNESYTLESVLETGEFVYAYPSKEQLKPILACGTMSGRDESKPPLKELAMSDAYVVSPPLLNDAVLNYECKVVHSYNVGQFTIVIGEIVKVHGSDKGNLDKIYALGGFGYGVISATETLQEGR